MNETMKILILNGPNLNLQGRRDTGVYGSQTFESYFEALKANYPSVEFGYFQSNIEGELIDAKTNKPVIKVVRKGEGKTLSNESTPLTADTLKQVIDDMAIDAVKFDPSQK